MTPGTDKTKNGNRFERLFGYALCCLVVFAMIVLIWSLGRVSGQQSERRTLPHRHATDVKLAAAQSCSGLSNDKATECVIDAIDHAEETARTEQDLTAQQQAAYAAMLSAGFTFLSVFIGVFGVWGLLRSLQQTDRGLDQARRANNLTHLEQEANRKAQRPMIEILPEQPEFIDWLRGAKNSYNWNFRLKNSGLTPAIIDTIDVHTFIVPMGRYKDYMTGGIKDGTLPKPVTGPKEGRPKFIASSETTDSILSEWSQPLPDEKTAADTSQNSTSSLQYGVDLKREIPANGNIIWLAGIVRYHDVWEKAEYETHCYYTLMPHYDGRQIVLRKSLVGGADSNYAT